jgi:uncharacterized protein YbjT (DUF2867 family)
MTIPAQSVLVLGGTGKTGSRVADRLTARGVRSLTAARTGAAVTFDWDDPSTYSPALVGVDRIYLVTPYLGSRDFAGRVSRFLDMAGDRAVRHVTYLSAHGIDQAPPEVPFRAVELDLLERETFTHSILRPAWFNQNFSEAFLRPVDDVIALPAGNGLEAFVDVEDVAAVAAATLADPGAHAAAQYTPTGPEAMTFSDAADIIARVSDRPITYHDVDREAWIRASIAAGVPVDYAHIMRLITDDIASGRGSLPNDVVQTVTGLPPISFSEFATRTKQAWVPRSNR